MIDNEANLEACAREPIHIPGAIQPHGAVVVLDGSTFDIIQTSTNLADFISSDATLDQIIARVRQWAGNGRGRFGDTIGDAELGVVAHRSGSSIIVEVERKFASDVDEIFSRLTDFAQQLTARKELADALSATVLFIADLTGFDRALAYRFDADWNGHVIAEAGNGELPSYLDLRFPAADIPAQARTLYALNRVRLIPDANYTPVRLHPERPEPLDMTYAQLRSVSPIHLEYMRNMGTLSSMSISIMVEDKLWGLVSCHSRNPHIVSTSIRDACDFLVQALAMRISTQSGSEDAARRVEFSRHHTRLLASMSSVGRWHDGLAADKESLLAITNAAGAAIVTEEESICLGQTPTRDDLHAIINRISKSGGVDYYVTDSLVAEMPEAIEFADVASGVLAARISEFHNIWLIWFRPEIVSTVTWAGNPHKIVQESGRIHPRRSFEAWKELLHHRSAPWHPAEEDAARELRASIVGIVLKRAEEVAHLVEELERSNKELEAFSYSVSHDLRAPFRHIVGFSQLLRERGAGLDDKSRHYLQMIADSALAAGRLVDDLLNFSQLGRATISMKKVDMAKLVAEVRQGMANDIGDRNIEWDIGPLPVACGDATLLRQVWFNLIDNAVKYTRRRDTAHIAISGEVDPRTGKARYSIADDGVGFDMAYSSKLFGVFQRLQRAEDFEGTGIGLALVRRIVERHGGDIAAEGIVDKGATFTFTLRAGT